MPSGKRPKHSQATAQQAQAAAHNPLETTTSSGALPSFVLLLVSVLLYLVYKNNNMSSPAVKAFTPLSVGNLQLAHRVVLAPLTRFRAQLDTHVPVPIMEEYYEQRASKGGLLVTEATYITKDSAGYRSAPGIFSEEQVEAWKKVTERVHKKGGYIFLQLWHVGRVAHSSVTGKKPVSSSDVPIAGNTKNKDGQEVPYDVPTPLTVDEIKELVQVYKRGAENAIRAGFDGVEIHSANGYLPHQFLEDGVNKRTDDYGGSVENRSRFVLEVADAVVGAVGAKRVGIRLFPWNPFQSMSDSNPVALYTHVLTELQKRHPDFAYVHFVVPTHATENPEARLHHFRKVWNGVFLSCGGYDAKTGLEQVETGGSDLVAFGKSFLANPDLVTRLQNGYDLNPADFSTFYGGSEKGYTDYPFYNSSITVTVSQ